MVDTKRDVIGIAKNKDSMQSNDVALDQMQRRITLMLRGGPDLDTGPVGFCAVNILNLRSSVQILASYLPKTGWKLPQVLLFSCSEKNEKNVKRTVMNSVLRTPGLLLQIWWKKHIQRLQRGHELY